MTCSFHKLLGLTRTTQVFSTARNKCTINEDDGSSTSNPSRPDKPSQPVSLFPQSELRAKLPPFFCFEQGCSAGYVTGKWWGGLERSMYKTIRRARRLSTTYNVFNLLMKLHSNKLAVSYFSASSLACLLMSRLYFYIN